MRPNRLAATLALISLSVPANGTLDAKIIWPCGSYEAPPYYQTTDIERRICPPVEARRYRSKFRGIAKEALDLESKACFIPDSMYELLDSIVLEVRRRAEKEGISVAVTPRPAFMERISVLTGEVLSRMGFGLHVPTQTLGDALAVRTKDESGTVHMIDCDTSALILMEIAESYDLPAAMVDITLRSFSGHSYVRWQVSKTEYFDWDTNAKDICMTPDDLPAYEGRAMSHRETTGYLFWIRALFWVDNKEYSKAAADYERAAKLYSTDPGILSRAAWLIATKPFPGREKRKKFALHAARGAVQLLENGYNLNVLACTLAFNGQFKEAARTEQRAIAIAPDREAYHTRLAQFQSDNPRDCTGAE